MREKRKKILKKLQIVTDADGTTRLSHHANPTTGMYRGRQVFVPKAQKSTDALIQEIEA